MLCLQVCANDMLERFGGFGIVFAIISSQLYVQMFLKSPIPPRSDLWDLQYQKFHHLRITAYYPSPNLCIPLCL